MALTLVPTAVKTANYAASVGDYVRVDVSAFTGDLQVFIPAGTNAGDLIGVVVENGNVSGTGRCLLYSTFTTSQMVVPDAGTATISGIFCSTIGMYQTEESIILQWDGSHWQVFSDNRTYLDRQHKLLNTGGSPYQAQWGDNLFMNETSAFTVTLPVPTFQLGPGVKIVNFTNNIVTVDGGSYGIFLPELGTRTQYMPLYVPYDSVTLEISGNGWILTNDSRLRMGSQITSSSGQTINTGAVGVDCVLGTANFDRGGIADTANNRLTIVRPGIYNVSASLSWDTVTTPNAAKVAQAILKVNGVNTIFTQQSLSASSMRLSIAGTLHLNAGDHLTLGVYQNSANNLALSIPDPPKLSCSEVR